MSTGSRTGAAAVVAAFLLALPLAGLAQKGHSNGHRAKPTEHGKGLKRGLFGTMPGIEHRAGRTDDRAGKKRAPMHRVVVTQTAKKGAPAGWRVSKHHVAKVKPATRKAPTKVTTRKARVSVGAPEHPAMSPIRMGKPVTMAPHRGDAEAAKDKRVRLVPDKGPGAEAPRTHDPRHKSKR